MKVLFLHGLESKPGGTKAAYLESKGYEVLNPALPKTDFEESIRIAQEVIDQEQPNVIVGSSRGGAVAMGVNPCGASVVLIAPGWRRFLNEEKIAEWNIRCEPSTTMILHSKNDDIIPLADSEEIVRNHGVKLIEVGTGHRMSDTDALEALHDVVKWLGGE